MTLAPEPPATRRLLPLETTHPMHGRTKGSRSALTCHWKCDDACAKPHANTSSNPYFRDIVAGVLSRRSVLAGSAAAAFVVAGSAAAPASAKGPKKRQEVGTGGTFGFVPIDPVPADVDAVTVADGWTWSKVLAWGDPVENDAPPADPARITPEAQSKQFGYNCDYTTLIRNGNGNGNSGLLVVNHEYTNDELMFPAFDPEAPTVEQVRVAMFAHGMSVVDVRRRGRRAAWQRDPRGRHNRRLHIETVFAIDGPAAGSPLLRTAEDPTGTRVRATLNNCAGGTTPWGTVLSGEENCQQYFRAPADPTDAETRYGLTSSDGRSWHTADQRFDMQAPGYRNEPNRFFWVVEVDPTDPTSMPVKHTALGRFKHEGATIRLAPSGHAVAYMGDDEVFEYIYKFVSRDTYQRGGSAKARQHNKRLLSEGDLYVARFTGDGDFERGFDGTGEWLPLVKDGRSRVPGMSVEEVLVHTRFAADRVGATMMDRPEDVQPNPSTGAVYAACTNNTRRDGRIVRGQVGDADATNPRSPNKDGHVVEILETGNDPRSTTFSWNLILVCGDPDDPSVPTYFGGYDGPVSPISCPDNVAFDSRGNLWVSTDGAPKTIGYNDALHLVPVAGPERGRVQQFLAVPTGAETCGPVVDLEDESVFVAVQHPGETDGASYEAPTSRFPYDGVFQGPRPGVIHVYPRR